MRLKHIRNSKTIEAARFDKGFEKSIKEGIEKGIEKRLQKGNSTTKIQIAKKMKSQGFDIDTIHKLKELPIEEVEKF